jgi:hypothetical protein
MFDGDRSSRLWQRSRNDDGKGEAGDDGDKKAADDNDDGGDDGGDREDEDEPNNRVGRNVNVDEPIAATIVESIPGTIGADEYEDDVGFNR